MIVGVIDDRRPEFVPDNRSVQPAIYLPIQQTGVLCVKPKGLQRKASDFIMKTIRKYLPESVTFFEYKRIIML